MNSYENYIKRQGVDNKDQSNDIGKLPTPIAAITPKGKLTVNLTAQKTIQNEAKASASVAPVKDLTVSKEELQGTKAQVSLFNFFIFHKFLEIFIILVYTIKISNYFKPKEKY